MVAARPPLASQRCARAFATTSDDDDQNRSLDALGDDFFERSRLEDRGNQRATPAGDLQYAGERPDNWEELLAEAEASYPERAGPRRSKHLKREARSGVLRASTCGGVWVAPDAIDAANGGLTARLHAGAALQEHPAPALPAQKTAHSRP